MPTSHPYGETCDISGLREICDNLVIGEICDKSRYGEICDKSQIREDLRKPRLWGALAMPKQFFRFGCRRWFERGVISSKIGGVGIFRVLEEVQVRSAG